MKRSQAREKLFLRLFASEFNGNGNVPEENEETEEKDIYTEESFSAITSEKGFLDGEISSYLVGRTTDRLSKVALTALRIAFYEIDKIDDVPAEVATDEAVELVKKYDSEESAKYVNGVLGSYIKKIKENA